MVHCKRFSRGVAPEVLAEGHPVPAQKNGVMAVICALRQLCCGRGRGRARRQPSFRKSHALAHPPQRRHPSTAKADYRARASISSCRCESATAGRTPMQAANQNCARRVRPSVILAARSPWALIQINLDRSVSTAPRAARRGASRRPRCAGVCRRVGLRSRSARCGRARTPAVRAPRPLLASGCRCGR